MMLYWKAKLSVSGLEPGQAENRMNRLISQYGKRLNSSYLTTMRWHWGAVGGLSESRSYVREEWPVIFGIDGLEEALKP